jgi:hypothetical protein
MWALPKMDDRMLLCFCWNEDTHRWLWWHDIDVCRMGAKLQGYSMRPSSRYSPASVTTWGPCIACGMIERPKGGK